MTKEKFNFIVDVLQCFDCIAMSFDVKEFIACQFALESDFGSSRLAKEYNNFCGMKKPYRRVGFYEFDKSTLELLQTSFGFAVYHNMCYCVLDYIAWLSYQHFTQHEMNNLSSFIIHLRNSGYCPEKGYIEKIQTIYQQFKNQQND